MRGRILKTVETPYEATETTVDGFEGCVSGIVSARLRRYVRYQSLNETMISQDEDLKKSWKKHWRLVFNPVRIVPGRPWPSLAL